MHCHEANNLHIVSPGSEGSLAHTVFNTYTEASLLAAEVPAKIAASMHGAHQLDAAKPAPETACSAVSQAEACNSSSMPTRRCSLLRPSLNFVKHTGCAHTVTHSHITHSLPSKRALLLW